MRAIVVVGMMVVAGSAWGQASKNWQAAVDSIAIAIAAAPTCKFVVSQPAVDEHLRAAGFSRDDKTQAAALDSAFQHQANLWTIKTASALAEPARNDLIAQECERNWVAFGPDGVIRKGILSKK
jgi:hypothetical protein